MASVPRLVYFLPFTLWAAAIYWLSGNKPPLFPDLNILSQDKIYHAIAYAWFALLGFGGWIAYRRKWLSRRQFLWVILLCASYGLLMEVLQYYLFIGRVMDWADAVANAIGCFIAWGFTVLIRPLIVRYLSTSPV